MNPSPVLYGIFADGEAPAHYRTRTEELLLAKEVMWEAILGAAEKQLVLPALNPRLRELGLAAHLPSDVVDFLTAVEQLNKERNQAILNELVVAATLLNSIGVEPILLKGAAYCVAQIYPNTAARYLWDIDLLIPESKLSAAVEVLLQNGFANEQTYKLGRFRHHYPPLRRKGAIHFELHHSLGMGICKSLLPAAEVAAQSTSLDFRGAHVRIPSPEHLMVHLIMHSQIQHPYNERIWPPLRALYDLILLRHHFRDSLDWAAVERRFQSARQYGTLALHILQLRDTLGMQPPITLRLTGLLPLRAFRRKLLRTLPLLRYLDPVYMYSTVLTRRLRLLQNALAQPGGWRHIANELLEAGFYKRFLTDILEGHGR